MRPVRLVRWSALALLLVGAASGCSGGATYQREEVAESVRDILAELGLNATARFLKHTLAVHLEYPGALSQTGEQIATGPGFEEALQKSIPAVHRVVLSSDADVRFYVLLVSDPTTPGAYLTMVRYVDDIRRAHANMLNTPEIFSRTVFDINYVGGQPLTLEQYVARDIRLDEFLSWQLARRIQLLLTEELEPTGAVRVDRCGGEFRNGEFAFTLNVRPVGDGTVNAELVQRAFDASAGVIAQVLSSYDFDAYRAIRLIHPATGRNLVLPKGQLELFR